MCPDNGLWSRHSEWSSRGFSDPESCVSKTCQVADRMNGVTLSCSEQLYLCHKKPGNMYEPHMCVVSPCDSWFVLTHFGIMFITGRQIFPKLRVYLSGDNGPRQVHRSKSPGNKPGHFWVRAEDGLVDSSSVKELSKRAREERASLGVGIWLRVTSAKLLPNLNENAEIIGPSTAEKMGTSANPSFTGIAKCIL